MAIDLSSDSFRENEEIPKKFTGEGENISPSFSWEPKLSEPKEFVLICDDPDAPGVEPFVHWIVYNIPGSFRILKEATNYSHFSPGKNSYENVSYDGPMPPRGDGPHHYRFRIYGLDEKLSLPEGLNKNQVLKSIEGHILEEGEVVGVYQRT